MSAMTTRELLVSAALILLEEEGEARFSTRAVCERVGVTAPTLYHHFGTADGLLSAAVDAAFGEYLARKRSLIVSDDPVRALAEGWDDYVAFARERPRLYSAMIARLLQGGAIPAAAQGRALLILRLQAVADKHRIGLAVEEAADVIWASAHAAAMLHAVGRHPPDGSVIAALREAAFGAIMSAEREQS